MVKPWWIELWNDYLSKDQTKERGKGTGDIQNRILSGESHGVLKYSTTQPKKDDWDGEDYLARFHFNVKNINLRSREGEQHSMPHSRDCWSTSYLMVRCTV